MRRVGIGCVRAALVMGALWVGTLSTSGCTVGAAYRVEGAQQVYLLTNLHPNHRRVISSVNHTAPIRGSLLPICTPVQIELVRGREIRFVANGMRYRYILHRSSRTTVDQHLPRYFGGQCPNVAAMSPEDQAGIQHGQVYQGMTKQGVIMALGYPPEHATPSLENDVWRYWSQGARAYEVYFTNGVVTGMRQ